MLLIRNRLVYETPCAKFLRLPFVPFRLSKWSYISVFLSGWSSVSSKGPERRVIMKLNSEAISSNAR